MVGVPKELNSCIQNFTKKARKINLGFNMMSVGSKPALSDRKVEPLFI
jgi:hypothetical protein